MALLRSMEVPAGLAPILLPGERLVTAVRAHWAKLAEPVATIALALDRGRVGRLQRHEVDPGASARSSGGSSSPCSLRLLWCLLDWSHNWFVATDKRLLLRYGLISHKVAMMPLLKVTDMSYVRSIPGQFLGYGKFVLESAGQDQALREVKWVPNPDQTYRDICAEIFHIVPPRRRGLRGDRRRSRPGARRRCRPEPDLRAAARIPDVHRTHNPSRTASTPTPGPCRSSVRPTERRDGLRERRPQASPARPRHRPDLARLRRRLSRFFTDDARTGARRRSRTPLVCDDPPVPDPLGGQHERVPHQVGRGLDGRVRRGRPQAEEDPQRPRPHGLRHRRHHRRRYLHADRQGREGLRRPVDRIVVRHRAPSLRPRRPLLRRVRLDGPGLGFGVHLLLRHARRARRLDHRLGPAARAHARRERGRPGLVAVLRDLPRGSSASTWPRVGRAGVALRPAGLPAHRRS